MKLKLAVTALSALLILGLAVSPIALSPSVALAGDDDGTGGGSGETGDGTGGGSGETGGDDGTGGGSGQQ